MAKNKVSSKKTKKPVAKAKTKPKIKAKSEINAKLKAAAKPKAKAKQQTTAKTKIATKAIPVAAVKKVDVSKFITPLDDRLIVQPLAAERMTAGGLYIPDTATGVSGNLKGLVISAGRGHRDKKGRLRPMDVKTGDQVVFAEFSGSKINIQGEDFMFLRETDILGILS